MSESNNNYLGNPDRPVLVKESWAKRVQAATAATERDAAFYGETGRPAFALSRFYDMRLAMLKSSWTQNQEGAYTATAAFVVSDAGAVDSSFLFPVYSIPGFTPSGTVDEMIFVVWRGRWEAIPTAESSASAVVRLASAWTLTNGVWTATANPVSAAGVVDTSTTVSIYAPQFTTRPPGVVGTYRLQVTWRNSRWESLQNVETLGYTPVRLASAWTLTNGVWTATGREVYADGTTSADAATIYAPQFTAQQTPPGTSGAARFWVMWRNNRWESVQDTIEGEVGDTLCPMILAQSWSRPTSNDIYRAPCYPLNANGAADTSGGTVTVYAPAAIDKPYGENQAWKFWAVYRNDRWETIQPNFPPQEGGGKNYVSGNYIDVSTVYDSNKGGYPINNTGVFYLYKESDATHINGAVEIDKLYFDFVSSSIAMQNKITLKTKRINVVTGITNGQPVKELIRVLDA